MWRLNPVWLLTSESGLKLIYKIQSRTDFQLVRNIADSILGDNFLGKYLKTGTCSRGKSMFTKFFTCN